MGEKVVHYEDASEYERSLADQADAATDGSNVVGKSSKAPRFGEKLPSRGAEQKRKRARQVFQPGSSERVSTRKDVD